MLKIDKAKIGWILVVVWMAVIFIFSAMPDTQSSQSSLSVLKIVVRILSLLNIHIDTDFLHFLVRKTAHGTEYFILTLLCIRAFRNTGLSIVKSIIYGFVLSVGYAATDEFHQLFVPGRGGKVTDVGIDSIGGCVGLLVYSITYKKSFFSVA